MTAEPRIEVVKRGSGIREGGADSSAADIVTAADGIAQAGPATLVWSERAADVAAAIQAAASGSVVTFVAHADMSRELVHGLAAEHAVNTILTAGHINNVGSATGLVGSLQPGEIVVMTSGTTGAPKQARHTIASLTATIRTPDGSGEARWLLAYPPSSFAGIQVMLTALMGGSLLVVPESRNSSDFVAAAVANGVTHISGTPTFWRSFLMALGDESIDLRSITIGGEAVDQTTLDRLSHRFPNATIRHIYASTELGVLFSVTDGEAGFPEVWLYESPGGAELRIRDEVLEARAERMMRGYASSHRAPVDTDGWYRTGDLVEVTAGRVQFRGRADRLINVAGYKVRPEEVELLILARDDVAEARVYGRAASLTGEIVAVEVVGIGVEDEDAFKRSLVTELRSHLESYKVPRLVDVVTAIDVSNSGKKAR